MNLNVLWMDVKFSMLNLKCCNYVILRIINPNYLNYKFDNSILIINDSIIYNNLTSRFHNFRLIEIILN